MQDSKLLLLIKSIDVSSLDRLKDFVASPYFKKREQVAKLIHYILDSSPNYEGDRLRKEECYKAIFANEKFKDVKIRRLMSDTLKLVEQFVLQEQLQVDEFAQCNLLTAYYNQNKVEDFYQEKFQEWKMLSKSQEGSILYLQRYLISKNYLQYTQNTEVHSRNEAEYQDALVFRMKELQEFYLFQTMFIRWILLQHQKNFNKAIQHPYEYFIQKIKEEDVIQSPLTHMYYIATLTTNDSEDEAKYLLLRQKLEILQKEKYHKKELTNLCKLLEAFLIRKSMEGDEKRYVDLLDLYKYEVKHKLVFSSDNYFYSIKFRNIAVVGTRVKDYDWLEDFMKKYRHTLTQKQQSTLYPYCIALLYFYQKKYDEAKNILLLPEDIDNILSFDIKRLQIMIYYEENDIDLLDAMMNSFRVLIFRDKFLSINYKEANKSFINMLFQMIRTKPNDHKKIEKMIVTLKSNKSFMERHWLLKKVLEMK